MSLYRAYLLLFIDHTSQFACLFSSFMFGRPPQEYTEIQRKKTRSILYQQELLRTSQITADDVMELRRNAYDSDIRVSSSKLVAGDI
jgi:hypothetical protein